MSKFTGLAPTPPMGWNTWNSFHSNINEMLVRESAEAMVANGMRDAGYRYVVLDDCWSTKDRDASGNLVANPDKFPSGMKALGDFLHERGFRFGIYNCAGTKTCAGYPGGHGHEVQDAKLYASWGVDYLKYDWCYTEGIDPKVAYPAMRDALRAAGRPIVFSLCEWGSSKPWEWAGEVGHLWRTTGDIMACYDCRHKWSMGWKRILDQQVGLEKFAGPDRWNDPDMLEVGVEGLTFAECRSHFALWCMLAAPLMAGNDVRHMRDTIRDLLTDRELIGINQDRLGKQAFRALASPQREVWMKELVNGNWAVCVHNCSNETTKVELDWKELPALGDRIYRVRDVLDLREMSTTQTPFTDEITWHDVAVFRLSVM